MQDDGDHDEGDEIQDRAQDVAVLADSDGDREQQRSEDGLHEGVADAGERTHEAGLDGGDRLGELLLAGGDALLHGGGEADDGGADAGLGVEERGVARHGDGAAFLVILVVELVDDGAHGVQEAGALETLVVVAGMCEERPVPEAFVEGALGDLLDLVTHRHHPPLRRRGRLQLHHP